MYLCIFKARWTWVIYLILLDISYVDSFPTFNIGYFILFSKSFQVFFRVKTGLGIFINFFFVGILVFVSFDDFLLYVSIYNKNRDFIWYYFVFRLGCLTQGLYENLISEAISLTSMESQITYICTSQEMETDKESGEESLPQQSCIHGRIR